MTPLRTLFLINLILFVTGSSLYPLLPLLDAGYGATPALIGIHLALLAGSNALGMALAGRLASRFALKVLFVAGALLGAAALAWLAAASALWAVMAATALLWFMAGVIYAQATLYTGLIAEEGSRGRSFSLLALASPFGAVLGGLAVGALVVYLGYGPAFLVLALLWLAIPALVLLALKERTVEPGQAAPLASRRKAPLGQAFPLLLITAILAAAASGVGQVGINLTMQALAFAPQATSSTTVVSGLAAIPVVFFAGTLSDRVGRRRVLLLSFLLIAVVGAGLIRASLLWQFWLGAAPLLVATLVSSSVLTALAADLLPRRSLERGLPLLMAAMTMTGMPSSIGAGYLIQAVGPAAAFAVAAGLALGALVTLFLLSVLQGQAPLFARPLHVNRTRPVQPPA